MKLSIITVNLNNRDGLKRTIDSVVSQTFRDFEWIVIDGGSTDGSKELIEEYAEHFSYWVSEPDNGIYNAMNKGVAHSVGEYCQFLNSGDYLNNETVLSCVSNYLNGDIIYGEANIYGQDGVIDKLFIPKTISLSFFYQSTICHQSSFIKRSLLLANPYDESCKYASDWKFYMQAALCNRSFTYIPFVICNYLINGVSSNFLALYNERASIISSSFPPLIKNDISLYEKFCSHLANTTPNVFIEMCEKHVLLSKLITAIILFMKKIK